MRRLALLVASLCCSACLKADDGQKHALAFDRSETEAADTITLSSPAFDEGQEIPGRYSAYGKGVSPPLKWSGVPPATVSLVLMMEDSDATSAKPYLHWSVWNIPATATGLPEGIGAGVMAGALAGIVQGQNNRRKAEYFGPRPPGSKAHHYHFQLFALDSELELEAGAKRLALIEAMSGHVIAKGKLLGLFTKPN